MSSALQRHPGDFGQFVRGWLADPRAVGAVAPSGKALARLMTREVHPGSRVLELGPGTGTVTQAILARGVDEDELFMVEQSPGFVAMLGQRFPATTIIQGDATKPDPRLAPLRGTIDVVVSGLPLVLFSQAQKRGLLETAFELLGDEGTFYQFTYGGRCPVSLGLRRELGLVARRIGIAAFNMPPAFVYRIARGA
jgi:phosphatidylethanolamine/phosphatidyl-N-methylethanolamine N-methyltransferase